MGFQERLWDWDVLYRHGGILLVALTIAAACSTEPDPVSVPRVLSSAQAWCGDTIQVTSDAYRGASQPVLLAGNMELPVVRTGESTVQATLPAAPCGALAIREVTPQDTITVGTVQTFGFVESFTLTPGAYYWITPIPVPGRTLVTGPTPNGAVVFDLAARTATELPGLAGTGLQFDAAGLSYEPGRVFWLDAQGFPTTWDYANTPVTRSPTHDPPVGALSGGSLHEISPSLWMTVTKHFVDVNGSLTYLEEPKDATWSPDGALMVLRNGWNSVDGAPVFATQTGDVAYHMSGLAVPNGVAFDAAGQRMLVAGALPSSNAGEPGVVAVVDAANGTTVTADTLEQGAAYATAIDRLAELLYVLLADNPAPGPATGFAIGVYTFAGERTATLAMPACPGGCWGGAFVVEDQEMFFVDIGGRSSAVFRFTLLPNR